MENKIDSPKNAIVAASLNLCGFGGFGYFYLGQKRKAVRAVFIWLLMSLTCVGPIVLSILTGLDAYKLGLKLENDDPIQQNECHGALLQRIFAFFGVQVV